MCSPKSSSSGGSKSGSSSSGNGKKLTFKTKEADNGINIVSSKQNIDGKSKYNQEYWANQIAPKVYDSSGKNIGGLGLTQAEVAAAQKAIGMDKAYSGDKVVTTANKDTAAFKLAKVTGSDATIQNGGVVKTTSKSGLFDERTTDKYDYSGNNPDVTVKTYDHKFDAFGKEIRLGAKTSTTFVDGTATNTVTNATGAANGVNSVVTNANADDIDDTVVADTVVSKSGTGTTKGTVTSTTPIIITKKDGGAVTKTKTTIDDTSLGGSAGAIANPDGLKNILAVSKGKRMKGKRNLRIAKTGQRVAGAGVGLNIA